MSGAPFFQQRGNRFHIATTIKHNINNVNGIISSSNSSNSNTIGIRQKQHVSRNMNRR
jgi:hypothetical protein